MDRNEGFRIVVVGANAAGLRAASRARRLMPNARVTVIDRGRYISYGACGMPYFVSGDLQSADQLRRTAYGVVRDEDFFRSAKGIEVVAGTEVERIDRAGRRVVCKSKEGGQEREFPYDRLVLATGSAAILPPWAKEGARVSTFKLLEDSIALRKGLQTGQISTVALVGAGPTGCELAEACKVMWGAGVLLFEAASQVLPAMLDAEMASAVERHISDQGVEVHTNCALSGISESDDGVTLKTARGDFVVDHVVFAIGVRPDVRLAAACGLTIGKTGGIAVDERMTTSDPDIFAAGDCVELTHMVSGAPVFFPLGSLANREGRVIGSNLGGLDERFGPVVGSSAVKVFDLNVSATGLTEKAAKDAGFEARAAWGTFMDLADYYPGSQNIQMKLVYDASTTRLLGLQAYSKGEAVKRVDVFAAYLKHGGKLEDLLDAEFAYAPPYAGALDPLYAIACTARNELLDGVGSVPPDADLAGCLVVDVRKPKEVSGRPAGAVKALNLPFGEFRALCGELPKDKDIICICEKGARSAEAVRILRQKGYAASTYLGGGLSMKPGDEPAEP